MNPITLEEFYDDTELPLRLQKAAQRNSGHLLQAGFAWLRERIPERKTP